ncbi:MAG: DedA family protein [Candidatus Methylomirabilales bacterium]
MVESLDKILAFISGLIVSAISTLGYVGIILAMALESACIPLPSEVIMPFSGYLAAQGRFSFFWVSVAGAFGCTVGSVAAYAVGARGGRPFLLKYGRYLLITEAEIRRADAFFERYGDKATFIARLLPVVRTFISLPAGIARMNFPRFVLYSFLGSLPWTAALAYTGMALGEHWEEVGTVLHQLDFLIAAAVLLAAVWFVRSRLRELRKPKVT